MRVEAAAHLEELDVSNNILRASGLAQASDALAHSPRLRVLNLGTNGLAGDAGESIGSVLRGAKNLEVRVCLGQASVCCRACGCVCGGGACA